MQKLFYFFIFLGFFMTTSDVKATVDIRQSANDKRQYDYAELANGLKLLVISDKDAQRAAAAVDVQVGSSSDPDNFLGLAHFLEHMLFLGTDKYPDPDDYINYISDHGGNHNAFTAFDHTNYFFDIDPGYLHQGLARFSRFFVAPTLSEKYVQRERNAVDSEYQSKLREDGWRGMDTLKAAMNKKHPYSRFTVGNLATLPEETVRPALLRFYEKHYSADRMTAVIVGRESPQTLLDWGRAVFSEVPRRKVADTAVSEQLFAGVNLPLVIESQSIKKEHNLSLYFQFPYQLDADYSKSLGYLSYILGYEGQGSLLEALKALGYANELYAGAGYPIGAETSFEIGVQLTDKGYANQNRVLAVIFAYIDLLKADDSGKSRYQEIATVADTAFQFKEKSHPMHEVSSLATKLNRYPVKDVLAINAIFSGYDRAQINHYLAQMAPADAVVQVTSPDITASQKTQYFNVPYAIKKLDKTLMTTVAEADKAVVKQMHLPHANPFIADDYALQKTTQTESHALLANDIELFYKHDTSFNVPKSSVQISLQPTKTLSIADKTAMSLLAQLLDEQLTTILYDASIAGVNAEISAGEKSLSFSLEGYQQKMPDLLTVMVKQLASVSVDAPTFARVKDNYRQDLQNAAAKMPYQQTFAYLNDSLVEDASLPVQRLEALKAIDAAKLQQFAEAFRVSLAIRMMVYGNQTETGAKALADILAKQLKGTKLAQPWQPNAPVTLTKNSTRSFAVDHDDNAITYYIQAGKGYDQRAKIGLLAKMLEPQFFTQLRTEKQLGYVVFAYPRPTFDQAGIAFTIQSPVADANALEKHITDFNAAFAQSLADLDEAAFSEVKTILKTELLQKPENLISAAGLYWSDILTTGKTTSSRKAIAAAIDKVERQVFIREMQDVLRSGEHLSIKAESHQ